MSPACAFGPTSIVKSLHKRHESGYRRALCLSHDTKSLIESWQQEFVLHAVGIISDDSSIPTVTCHKQVPLHPLIYLLIYSPLKASLSEVSRSIFNNNRVCSTKISVELSTVVHATTTT